MGGDPGKNEVSLAPETNRECVRGESEKSNVRLGQKHKKCQAGQVRNTYRSNLLGARRIDDEGIGLSGNINKGVPYEVAKKEGSSNYSSSAKKSSLEKSEKEHHNGGRPDKSWSPVKRKKKTPNKTPQSR